MDESISAASQYSTTTSYVLNIFSRIAMTFSPEITLGHDAFLFQIQVPEVVSSFFTIFSGRKSPLCFLDSNQQNVSVLSTHHCPAVARTRAAGLVARSVLDVGTPSPCVQTSSRTSGTTGCSKPLARATSPK